MKGKKAWSAVPKPPGPTRGSPGGRVAWVGHGLLEIRGVKATLLLCPVGTNELPSLHIQQIKLIEFFSFV